MPLSEIREVLAAKADALVKEAKQNLAKAKKGQV